MATTKDTSIAKKPRRSIAKASHAIAVDEAEKRDENIHPRLAFIKSIKFSGIGLDKASFNVDRAALTQARIKDEGLEVEIDINYSVLAHENEFFVVGAEFELKQNTQDSAQLLVSIRGTFSARFDLISRADPELVKRFATLEAKLVFFPYLRHFVSDSTYRMSIDPIILPLTSELAAS